MLPELFCENMQALLGPEYEAFLAALDRPRALGLRLNPLKICPSEPGEESVPGPRPSERSEESVPPIFNFQGSRFNLTPVPWCPTGYFYDPETRPGLHPWHSAGAYYLQEPSAMAPAELLGPRPGERVLDLCAAPGGKSTQLAGAMLGQGLLVCNEINPKRAAVLASNIERLGIANALVLNEHPARLAERFEGFFDRILVDAPCSGEGMFRKHDAAWSDWSPETVAMCARRQAKILDCAARMLRPGGRLVYSTCTFSPEENEGSVAGLLRRHPEFDVEAVEAPNFAPGRPAWADGDPRLARCFRLWPHKLTGEGHFAAVLRKTGPLDACHSEGREESVRPSGPNSEKGRKRGRASSSSGDGLPAPMAALLWELGIRLPAGKPVLFGERVFWAPAELPELRGLKVLRPGLELGSLRGKLAIPAHALALWTREAAQLQELRAEDPACAAYLRGETIPTGAQGWTLVRVDGLSLGWGKAVGGVLKNHYPKGLRL